MWKCFDLRYLLAFSTYFSPKERVTHLVSMVGNLVMLLRGKEASNIPALSGNLNQQCVHIFHLYLLCAKGITSLRDILL